MADTAITRTALGHDISYRQAQMPAYSYGTFVADDTDYHALLVDGRGKGRLSYGVDNASNKEITITLYGTHSATGVVAGDGTFAIDSTGFAVSAASTGYETNNDPFPWYIVRAKFATLPDSETVTIYANFSAF